MATRRIIYPLDYPNLAEARRGAEAVRAEIGVIKVGLELFVKEGPPALALGRELGLDVFADLKLHDIPETVERAIGSVAAAGAKFVTVHASGGPTMLARAVERARKEDPNLVVLAVTVLTSLDQTDLAATGVAGSPADQVVRLARMAYAAGVRGFVCSPAEVGRLRAELPDAVLVTPGVRPAGASLGDQKRVATPSSAIHSGADLLVVGRPIRDAADPAAAAREIDREIAQALSERRV